MIPDDLQDLDTNDLRALLITATDELLFLAAAVINNAESARAGAVLLAASHAWPADPTGNTYSDGTVIAAPALASHLHAPPHHRRKAHQ